MNGEDLDDAITKPLSIIYKNCIESGIHSHAWKKSNMVPVQEKGRLTNC